MENERKALIKMVDLAYSSINDYKFKDTRKKLLYASRLLNNNEDIIKVMILLRSDLLCADLSLNIKDRISKLPVEYRNIYSFIEPRLKKVDSKLLDKYMHFGFIPLKFGNTIKYP